MLAMRFPIRECFRSVGPVTGRWRYVRAIRMLGLNLSVDLLFYYVQTVSGCPPVRPLFHAMRFIVEASGFKRRATNVVQPACGFRRHVTHVVQLVSGCRRRVASEGNRRTCHPYRARDVQFQKTFDRLRIASVRGMCSVSEHLWKWSYGPFSVCLLSPLTAREEMGRNFGKLPINQRMEFVRKQRSQKRQISPTITE